MHKALKIDENGNVKFSRYHVTRLPKGLSARVEFIKEALGFEELYREEKILRGSYGDGRLAKGGDTYEDHVTNLTLGRSVKVGEEEVKYRIYVRYETTKRGTVYNVSCKLHRSDRKVGRWNLWKAGGYHKISLFRCGFPKSKWKAGAVLEQGLGEKRCDDSIPRHLREVSYFNGLLDLFPFKEKDLP